MKHIIIFSLLLIFIGCSTQKFATKEDLYNAYESLQKSDITRYDMIVESLNNTTNKMSELEEILNATVNANHIQYEKLNEKFTKDLADNKNQIASLVAIIKGETSKNDAITKDIDNVENQIISLSLATKSETSKNDAISKELSNINSRILQLNKRLDDLEKQLPSLTSEANGISNGEDNTSDKESDNKDQVIENDTNKSDFSTERTYTKTYSNAAKDVHVKGHTRTTKSGKTVYVKPYVRSRPRK